MTSFTYTSNVPDGPNDPSEDQPIMEVNNNSAEDIWDVDHVGFNLNFGGTHNVVRLNQLSVAPTLQAASQSALFQRNVKGATELFYRYGNSTQNVYQVTDYGPTVAVNGESNMFGPVRVKWGQITPIMPATKIANGQQVNFINNFATAVYSVIITGETSSTDDKTINVTSGSVSLSGFTVITSGTSSFTKLYWVAIGS